MGVFEKDKVYDNVYMVFVDASGHSNIVKQNPSDKASKAFDTLYRKMHERLMQQVSENRCQKAVVWSWLGDGGLIAIHDEEESKAVNLALSFAKTLLNPTLKHLQDEFADVLHISGELHLRISIHKGTIKYTDEGQQGFVHSTDINFGAHLEKVTPKDCVLISKDVFLVLDNQSRKLFTEIGEYEDHIIYAYSPILDEQSLQRKWIISRGFHDVEFIQAYCQRLSEQDKAHLIRNAKQQVIDFGTTLNTCSNYLFSTARPTPYRDAVHDLISRGGKFHCYMVEPDSVGAKQLAQLRGEDTNLKLSKSLERFNQYVMANAEVGDSFSVFSFPYNPNFAAMVIDPDSDDALCLYSPYFSDTKHFSGCGSERADMPHYLLGKDSKLYSIIWAQIQRYREVANRINFSR